MEYHCQHSMALSAVLMKNDLVYGSALSSAVQPLKWVSTTPESHMPSPLFSIFFCSLSKDVVVFFTKILLWKPVLKTELLQLACLFFFFYTSFSLLLVLRSSNQIFRANSCGYLTYKCISHKLPVRYILKSVILFNILSHWPLTCLSDLIPPFIPVSVFSLICSFSLHLAFSFGSSLFTLPICLVSSPVWNLPCFTPFHTYNFHFISLFCEQAEDTLYKNSFFWVLLSVLPFTSLIFTPLCSPSLAPFQRQFPH